MAAAPRRWLWFAIPAVVLLLVCIGASTGSWIAQQEVAARSSPFPPISPSTSPPAPTFVVRLPDALLGRARTTDPALLRSAEQAVAAQQSAESSAQAVLSTYYGSLNRRNLVFVLVVQAHSSDPQSTYARLVDAMEQQQSGLDLIDIDPGTLGGQASCGEAPVSGGPVTFCVWVDAGSYGFVEFFGVHVGPQRSQFLRARSQIETIS